MCDSIEGVRPVNMSDITRTTNSSTIGGKQPSAIGGDVLPSNISADGVGLEKALANFAMYYKHEEMPGCKYPVHLESCLSTPGTDTGCSMPGVWLR